MTPDPQALGSTALPATPANANSSANPCASAAAAAASTTSALDPQADTATPMPCGASPGLPINLPEVHAEVSAQFARYEAALTGNDVAVLDELFWPSPHTLRYGATENLYGYDAIAGFRAARPAQGLAREVLRTAITTYGQDFATTNIEFRRHGSERTGRQSQTWLRTPQGWRVVAAHVSLLG